MKQVFILLLIANVYLIAGCFTDVPNDNDEICSAVKQKWIKGYEDGSFKPNNKINRAESAKLLFKFYEKLQESQSTCFSDVRANDWFSGFVCPLTIKTPIINGRNDGKFHPADNVTFAEASKMALTSLGYVKMGIPWYKPYTDVIITLDSKYFGNFSHDRAITRREFIHILMVLNFAKENPFFLTKKIMKKVKPFNDIGEAIDIKPICVTSSSTLGKRVKERKFCFQRFKKQELAIVYNDDNRIDFVVPYVPLFNEFFTSRSTKQSSIIPSKANDSLYTQEKLFQKESCNNLNGDNAEGCHILSVGMIDHFYKNERVGGSEISDYNKWLKDNGQSVGCGLILRDNKKYMKISGTGEIKIEVTFSIGDNHIDSMQTVLNGIPKLQSYIKTRRPVLLQYTYEGSSNNTHAIVIVGKDSSGNYIVQDPYFNRLDNGRITMFLTLEEAIANQTRERETTKITFTKVVFYHND